MRIIELDASRAFIFKSRRIFEKKYAEDLQVVFRNARPSLPV
jgi:hypothetical protein